jgi:hypothetical protein
MHNLFYYPRTLLVALKSPKAALYGPSAVAVHYYRHMAGHLLSFNAEPFCRCDAIFLQFHFLLQTQNPTS